MVLLPNVKCYTICCTNKFLGSFNCQLNMLRKRKKKCDSRFLSLQLFANRLLSAWHGAASEELALGVRCYCDTAIPDGQASQKEMSTVCKVLTAVGQDSITVILWKSIEGCPKFMLKTLGYVIQSVWRVQVIVTDNMLTDLQKKSRYCK